MADLFSINLAGAGAVLLAIAACVFAAAKLRPRPVRVRFAWLGVFGLLSMPALLFVIYYLHVLPEWEWFYTFRSWRGSEFCVLFVGAAGGALASLLPRLLLGLPLFGVLAVGVAPYVKPLLSPLPAGILSDQWSGAACRQSTGATCGPASLATILRHFGHEASEPAIARAAFSCASGTEAWYLARYARRRGFAARFDFRADFSPEAAFPAIVGVRLPSGIGHFIPVLEIKDGQVRYADPLEGENRLALADFQRRYRFTGFHLTLAPR